MNRKKILKLIKENPIQIGKWIGFEDLTEIHNTWLKSFLFAVNDQTLQGHRGSYKTTVLSLFFAICIVIFPNKTILYFRKTDTDVKEVGRQVVKILNTGCMRKIVNIIYGKDLTFIKQTDNEIHTNLCTTNKGTSQLVGLGIGTSITGKHADIVVTDDIVNIKDRQSRAEREKTKIAYMELENIKNRGGRFINTGTPWHKDDCFQLMPKPKKYTWKDTGLITEEEAEKIKSRLTNSLFAVNYELRHIPEDDIIFSNPKTGAEREHVINGWSHVDSAYYGEDYTAFTVVNIHDGKYYVYGRCWRKHIDNVMDEIVELNNKFLCQKLYTELNADKGYVAKQLRTKGVKVSTYTEHQNKYIKIVSHLKFEWNDVIFVDGTDEKYIEQICDFNENVEHDDCADSLASLIRVLSRRKKRS